MPNTKSAVRRTKRTQLQASVNRIRKSKYKSIVKEIGLLITAKKKKEAELGPEVRAKVLEGLRILAGVDDGAVSLDDQGFNKFDTEFGQSLAAQDELTEKQTKAGINLIRKYQKQKL